MTIKAIIFDVDGTLADTEDGHRKSFNKAFAENNLPWNWDVELYDKLLKVTGIKDGTALITGGLALDEGLLAAIQEEMVNEKVAVTAVNHPDSIYAGAIGAALWGAFRHGKLNALQQRAAA